MSIESVLDRLAELETSAPLRHRLSRVFGREFVAAAPSMFAFTQRQGRNSMGKIQLEIFICYMFFFIV